MALTTNLNNYWKLDESSGNAADSVGSLTLTNSGTEPYAAGKINNGIQGNGTGSLSNLAAYSAIAGGTYSMGGWYKPSSSSVNDMQVAVNDHAKNLAYHTFYVHGTGVIHAERVRSGVVVDAALYTASLSDGVWYHIMVTYASNTITIYLNGASVATQASSGVGSHDDGGGVAIGGSEQDGSSQLANNAMIDEIGIWTRALSASEVNQLYNAGFGLQYPFPPTGVNDMKSMFQ